MVPGLSTTLAGRPTLKSHRPMWIGLDGHEEGQKQRQRWESDTLRERARDREDRDKETEREKDKREKRTEQIETKTEIKERQIREITTFGRILVGVDRREGG